MELFPEIYRAHQCVVTKRRAAYFRIGIESSFRFVFSFLVFSVTSFDGYGENCGRSGGNIYLS